MSDFVCAWRASQVIDGHRVLVNETTYTNGDVNHKSFYHFKEVQVLPDDKPEKITNENAVPAIKDEQDEETNEIKRDPPAETVVSTAVVVDDSKPNLKKKVE